MRLGLRSLVPSLSCIKHNNDVIRMLEEDGLQTKITMTIPVHSHGRSVPVLSTARKY